MQQQPGINGFNAAITGQDPSSPMTNPHMAMMNPVMQSQYTGAPPGMLNPANTMSADLKDAMRSFRDSLAFSFQSLNLTLSTLNQTVSTVGTKLGRMTPNTNDLSRNQYMQVGTPGVYLGAMSAGMANYIGNNNFGSLFSHYAPANVSPLEFYTERARELGLRSSNMALTGLGGLSEELVNYGASMWAGRKILGAMGIGAGGMLGEMGAWLLGSPIGVAASVGLSYLTDPIIEYGTRHNRDVAAMRRMSPRMGPGFDLRQSQRAIGGLEQLALRDTLTTNSLQPRMGLEGFRELTMMGLQGNMFQGSSADDLIKQVSSASFIVKFLAGVMGNKDVRETMTLVKQLKDMGVNVFQAGEFAKSLGMDAFKYGRTMGVDSGSLLNSAANMSMAAYGQFGNPAYLGIRQGMNNLAYMQELEKRGIMTPADIAAGGGAQNIGARMLGVQAGMMNSWNVGLPMLYAGWNGDTGFDQGRFNKAFAGGNYWGALAGATQNMLSGGIPGLTHVMMNKNNIMSSAAEQGVLDQNTLAMLDSMLRNTPGYNDPSIPLDQKESMAAYYLMQMSPQIFQTQIDPATAKALAKQVVSPSIQARINAIAAGKARQGAFEYVSAGHGIGRFTESIGESWEKFKARVHDTFIGKPGRNIADFFSDRFEKMHGNPFLDNDYSNAVGLASYNWGKQYATGSTIEKITPQQFKDAFNRLHDPTSLVHLGGRLFNRDINYLEDSLAYNLHIKYADRVERMSDPKKRLTPEEFMAKYSDILGTTTLADLTRQTSVWEQTKQDLADDISLSALSLSPYATGTKGRNELTRSAYNNVKNNMGVMYDNYDLNMSEAVFTDDWKFGQGIKNLRSNSLPWKLKEKEVRDIVKKLGIDPNNIRASEFFGSDVMQFYNPNTERFELGANHISTMFDINNVNSITQPIRYRAQRNNLSSDDLQRAFDFMAAQLGAEGEHSGYALTSAVFGRDFTNDGYEAFGKTPNNFQRRMFDSGMEPLSLNKDRMDEYLAANNITPTMFREWAVNTSSSQKDAYIEALTSYAQKVGNTVGSLDAYDYKDILSSLDPTSKKQFEAFIKKNPTARDVNTGLAEVLGESSRYYKTLMNGADLYDETGNLVMKYSDAVRGGLREAYGGKLTRVSKQDSVSALRFLGLASDESNVMHIMDNLPKFIKEQWGNRRDLSQEQRRILSEVTKLDNLDISGLAKKLGVDESEVSTAQGRAEAIQHYTLSLTSQIAKKAEDSENRLVARKKSAIDTAVRMSAWGPVVATIDANMLTKVRDDMSKATTDYSKYVAAGVFKSSSEVRLNE